MQRKLLAALLAATMVMAAGAPAVTAAVGSLSVDATQGDAGEATVTVTNNNSTVENATVTVESSDNYSGTGEYLTDENGTVTLPAPNETVNVTVRVTHDGENASVSTVLVASDEDDDNETDDRLDPDFGQQLNAYIDSMNESNETIAGGTLATWVVANNPGDAPAHAGPPDAAGGDDAGPPEDAGQSENAAAGNDGQGNGEQADDEDDEEDDSDN